MKQKLPLLILLIVTVASISCKKNNKENPVANPPSPPDPPMSLPAVLIKDVAHASLPSPFYHFEYDAAGKATFVSYASDLRRYNIIYEGNRIIEMRNNITVILIYPNNDTIVTSINKDRLQYFYDNIGRVNVVTYADSTGLVNTRINLIYDGAKLIKFERERKSGAGFIIDKTITITYYPDGNLQDITVHQPAIIGQNYTDRYEQYDNKINAEGFSLLHDEFFDHFVFLPGVQLQKNNPGKQTRTGDGNNFKVDYVYTYDNRGAPFRRGGDFVYTSGPKTGQRFQLSSTYTYYP
ncbi:MAG TPA: hypothetical protein VJ765_17030 [Chitinophagaceae bacterium]|nr:hypothetical protein [Chitinophagaceae bacterium]